MILVARGLAPSQSRVSHDGTRRHGPYTCRGSFGHCPVSTHEAPGSNSECYYASVSAKLEARQQIYNRSKLLQHGTFTFPMLSRHSMLRIKVAYSTSTFTECRRTHVSTPRSTSPTSTSCRHVGFMKMYIYTHIWYHEFHRATSNWHQGRGTRNIQSRNRREDGQSQSGW